MGSESLIGALRVRLMLLTLALFATAACAKSNGDAGAKSHASSIRLFNAASIARPLRVLADSFTARTRITVVQENQSSLELARKLTEFNDIPDVIALADHQVFPKLLSPKFVDGWWLFARNRMVLGYTEKSLHQDLLVNDGWRHVVTMPDVEVGRSDPNTDPSGYRTLMAFQLAELHYNEPGLAKRLLVGAAEKNVRPREADQVGMLQAGELDYIWTYENLARGAGLKFVWLPAAVDLSTAEDSSFYSKASVRVAGKQRGDSVTFHGEPILYGVAVPTAAADTTGGYQFLAFMLSADGQRILHAASLDALDKPIAVKAATSRPVKP
ncbi:MAG: extracellular solute-binding protein [Gemmatimonadaceae bacterium]